MNAKKFQYVVCKCSNYLHINTKSLETVLSLFSAYAVTPLIVNDLCGILMNEIDAEALFGTEKKMAIIACHERAITALIGRSRISEERYVSFDLRKNGLDKFESFLKAHTPENVTSIIEEKDKKEISWYPVIDYSRCKNCKQCLNFCLFGVYSLSKDQKVMVTSPEACKTGCPACARICPEVAIVFPKHDAPPINGDFIEDETLEKEKAKANSERLLGNDVYQGLEKRKEKRQQLIRRKEIEKAYLEREEWHRKNNGQGS